MKYHLAIGFAGFALCLMTLVHSAGAEGEKDYSAVETKGSLEKAPKSFQGFQKKNVPSLPPSETTQGQDASLSVRDIPSISGRYSFGGKTLMPYIGAGFSGGYSSEFSRSMANPSPAPTEQGNKNYLGQVSSPNEFQMGLRIPF